MIVMYVLEFPSLKSKIMNSFVMNALHICDSETQLELKDGMFLNSRIFHPA